MASLMPVPQPLSRALAFSLALHVLVLGAVASARQLRNAAAPKGELGASFAGATYDIDEVLTRSEGRAAEKKSPEPAPAAAEKGADPTPLPRAEPARTRAQKREPASAESSPGTSPSAAAASSGTPPSGEGGPTGTSGVAGNTANLGKAFAKAVTAATHRDPLWAELPLGPVGAARIVITVDAEGKITGSKLDESEKVPAPLTRLVERTLVLLRSGRFALSGGELRAGSQTLLVEVVLSSTEPSEDYDDPRHTLKLGFEPPQPGKAGRSYFVHADGRRFDAKISLAE